MAAAHSSGDRLSNQDLASVFLVVVVVVVVVVDDVLLLLVVVVVDGSGTMCATDLLAVSASMLFLSCNG